MYAGKIIRTLSLIALFGAVAWTAAAQQLKTYPVISYLKIPVDSLGNLPENPYVIKLDKNEKQLVAIGTQHTMDTASQMFVRIENEFKLLHPEVVINEGGNLTRTYSSRNEAIAGNGELGLEKFLADNSGIKTLNGDMPDKLEYDQLASAFSPDEALFYFATERFIFPYRFGGYPGKADSLYYPVFIKGYLEKEGIVLKKKQKTFTYYKTLYRRYFHQPYNLDSLQQLDFIPFATRSHFNTVSRASKGVRDQYLLHIVSEQIKLHRRVLLIFGGWHILSIEPAFTQVMEE